MFIGSSVRTNQKALTHKLAEKHRIEETFASITECGFGDLLKILQTKYRLDLSMRFKLIQSTISY